MKILVVGGGGREHAIIKKLKENPEAYRKYCEELQRALKTAFS